jgi:hypothetical protein
MVDDRVNGRVFPAGDLAALKQAILDVTDPGQIGRYRDHAKTSLVEYRRRVDPVAEIRRALTEVGVLNG